VAASLLRAVGLPELIAATESEYEELAVALARDASRLASLKHRLAMNRPHSALFDSRRLTRDLETAYAMIHERYLRGLPAEHIEVPGS
jgi:protein O-GlcNAc transferase